MYGCNIVSANKNICVGNKLCGLSKNHQVGFLPTLILVSAHAPAFSIRNACGQKPFKSHILVFPHTFLKPYPTLFFLTFYFSPSFFFIIISLQKKTLPLFLFSFLLILTIGPAPNPYHPLARLSSSSHTWLLVVAVISISFSPRHRMPTRSPKLNRSVSPSSMFFHSNLSLITLNFAQNCSKPITLNFSVLMIELPKRNVNFFVIELCQYRQ